MKITLDRLEGKVTIFTNICKGFECNIILHLLVNPVVRDRVVGHVFHICIVPVQSGIQYWCSYAANIRVLITLDFVQSLEQSTMKMQELNIVVVGVM